MRTEVSFGQLRINIAATSTPPTKPHGPRCDRRRPPAAASRKRPPASTRGTCPAGLVTLALRTPPQKGESGGTPRGLEDPAHQTSRHQGRVSFSPRARRTTQRIGALGHLRLRRLRLNATASDHRNQGRRTSAR